MQKPELAIVPAPVDLPATQKRTGYEPLAPAFINAGVALLSDLGFANRLAKGQPIDQEQLTFVSTPSIVASQLDFLHIHGALERNGDEAYRIKQFR